MVKKTDVKYQKIVRTAHDLFVSKGYDTVTISEVAREAGIAKGGMYYYFDSKEALLKAVHAQLAQEVARKVSEEITQAKKVGFDALQYFFERQNSLFSGSQFPSFFLSARFEAIYAGPNQPVLRNVSLIHPAILQVHAQ